MNSWVVSVCKTLRGDENAIMHLHINTAGSNMWQKNGFVNTKKNTFCSI